MKKEILEQYSNNQLRYIVNAVGKDWNQPLVNSGWPDIETYVNKENSSCGNHMTRRTRVCRLIKEVIFQRFLKCEI